MRNIATIYQTIDQIAPFSTAESWDNVGLLVGDPTDPVTKVLLALDITIPVIEEALQLGANLIITHHPVIFAPLKKLSSTSLVYRLAQEQIGVISAHTNLDMAQGGVNDALAAAVGLTMVEPLAERSQTPFWKLVVFVPTPSVSAVYQAMTQAGAGELGDYSGCGFSSLGEGQFQPEVGANPAIGQVGQPTTVDETRLEMLVAPSRLSSVVAAMVTAHPYETPAYDLFQTHGVTHTTSLCRLGQLATPRTAKEFAAQIKSALGVPTVRYTNPNKIIQRVALCGGSGGDFLDAAITAGADAYLTGELAHHKFLESQSAGIALFEAGHFSTEQVFMEPLKQQLMAAHPSLEVYCSTQGTDGILSL